MNPLQRRPFSLWLATALCCLAAGTAQATPGFKPLTLNFDELGPETGGLPMPAGYAGFQWGSQWHYLTSPQDTGQTYLAMDSSSGTLIYRTDRQAFYFDGASFWSRRGLDANGSFYFVLYLNGKTVFDGTQSSKTRMRFNGTPTFMVTGYKGRIDAMAFAFKNNDWDQFAADDFKFRIAKTP
jgi:hypothetical protein